MPAFRVLIYGDDISDLPQMTRSLQEMGLEVCASPRLTDLFSQPCSIWNVRQTDIEGVTNLLRWSLPMRHHRLSNLTMIGVMSQSTWESNSLSWDTNKIQCPAETTRHQKIIVIFPSCRDTYWLGKRDFRHDNAPMPSVGLI